MVKVRCINSGITVSIPEGTSLIELYNKIDFNTTHKPLCGSINNHVKNLNVKIYDDVDVEFFDVNTNVGNRMYKSALFFILSKALQELHPGAKVELSNSISKGYYCPIHIGRALSEADITELRLSMERIIQQAIPFVRHRELTTSVVEKMRALGRTDIVRLLESSGKLYSTYYSLDGVIDYFHAILPPDTSYIHLYSIDAYADGVLLRIPSIGAPDHIEDMVRQDKMFNIFEEFHSWQRILGISNLGDLNLATQKGYSNLVINIAEALQSKKIVHIADSILERKEKNNNLKLIMISGPSSSGKTTFSKRLQIQLLANGLNPKVISLDDYFVDRTKTPRDANGDYDYESLYAIDLELFNHQLQELLAGNEVELPTFNFRKGGVREYIGNTIKLGENDVLLIEGIHALNPALTPSIPSTSKFLIYVSALTSIKLDEHNYIPTTDNRLLRRILRDYKYRKYSAKDTIARWPSVRAGEERWIFPFQENADAMFNSAMIFEIALIRDMVEPVLLEVPEDCPEYIVADRLRKFLKKFTTIPSNNLPPTSLIREFIGGSSFKY